MYGQADWRTARVRVGYVERHVWENRTTKLSDTMPTRITDGTLLYPHELMFIMPVRNVIEGRNNGILDTTMYSAIGRIDRGDLIGQTSGKGCEALSERHGMTEEDRALRLTAHALCHLQNTVVPSRRRRYDHHQEVQPA
ncbi:hypothetical protein [Sinorhizobium meliloti]|uniref:hypothetical protein n=1 Tax=Rhizobium meliloti TaxID=382 RepID=UPI001294B415|nr:hypothetical protein [Sinorhizobium meliloti]MQW25199.1 hypothetical protein [Sinorhizobium meliloti]